MRELATTGFEDECAEVGGFRRLELFLRKGIKPWAGVGQDVFPTAEEKEFLVKRVRLFSGVGEGELKPTRWQSIRPPGDEQVRSWDADDIKDDDVDVR